MAPKIHLRCCLCGKRAPQKKDVLPLDAEWRRRHPKLPGMLACECAYSSRWYWRCDGLQGRYEDGHIAKGDPDSPNCFDSVTHLGNPHTLTAAVIDFPESALAQGAHEYVRYKAHARETAPKAAIRLQQALAAWDGRDSV